MAHRAKCPNRNRGCVGFEGNRSTKDQHRCGDCYRRWYNDWYPQQSQPAQRAPRQPQMRNGVPKEVWEAQRAAALAKEAQRKEGRQGQGGQRRQRFERYSSSETRDTGTPQTDLYFGEKGTKGGHVAVDDSGTLRHVRDEDGTVLYDHNEDVTPPIGW